MVQRLDITLRLAYGRAGNNIEQQARDWVVKQNLSPGFVARDPRTNSTIGVCRNLHKSRRRCATRWVENIMRADTGRDRVKSLKVLSAYGLQSVSYGVKEDTRSGGGHATVQQANNFWTRDCVGQVV